MSATMELPGKVSSARIWIGRVLSGLALLFLLMDGLVKIVPPPMVMEITTQLGYPASVIPALGILLTAITLLAIFPRTAVIGTILLTGYLGGAIATHVRVQDAPFSHIFPILIGGLLWGGLALRRPELAAVIFGQPTAKKQRRTENDVEIARGETTQR